MEKDDRQGRKRDGVTRTAKGLKLDLNPSCCSKNSALKYALSGKEPVLEICTITGCSGRVFFILIIVLVIIMLCSAQLSYFDLGTTTDVYEVKKKNKLVKLSKMNRLLIVLCNLCKNRLLVTCSGTLDFRFSLKIKIDWKNYWPR